MTGDGILIVGGGLASQRAIETLRARGYEGRIQLVCGEAELPYDRPPLSKGLLSGKTHESEIGFQPARWYADQRVELILGHRATGLDEKQGRVRLDDGRELAYDALLIATGSAPRILPLLARFSNVHFLRTLADARRLRDELREGARLTIVGAGFIGQEVAATARATCAEVTLIEALPAPLGSVLGDAVGRWLMRMHAERGCRRQALHEARGSPGQRHRRGAAPERRPDARLRHGGRRHRGRSRRGLAAGSRLGTDGVITDRCGRTPVPDVFAAGDVTRGFDPHVGEHRRSEHWDAAARQGVAAARTMLGETSEPAPATELLERPVRTSNSVHGLRGALGRGHGRGESRSALLLRCLHA